MKFNSKLIHSGWDSDADAEGAITVPIYRTTAYQFNNTEHAAACCWLWLRCCRSAAGIVLGWAPPHQPSAAAQRPTWAHTIREATLYGRLIGWRLILIGWAHPISGATL